VRGCASGGQTSVSAAQLAPTYAPELEVVETFTHVPVTDIVEAIAGIDGNFLAVMGGYLLRGIIAAYPQTDNPSVTC
jgi:triacylglycerol lipase